MDHQETAPRAEAERLRELFSLKLLDTQQDERFQRYTRLAADILDTPISFISLVGRDRLWFKASCGLTPGETTRSASFCTYAVAENALLVVEDTREDSRFAGNPLVQGEPFLRFYAGHPIHGPSGRPLGTLCIFDHKPRTLDEEDRRRLLELAELVEHEIQQSYQIDLLREQLERTAYYDPLTQLPNQRLLRDRLEFSLQLAHQQGQRLGVAILDIRDFGTINHTFGTSTGDALLRCVANGLSYLHPEPKIVARWHDDEFVVVDPAMTLSPEAFARGIQSLFEKPLRAHGHEHHLDIDLGIAIYPDAGADADTLLRRAVTAMHANMEVAGAQGEIYRPALEVERSRKLAVTTQLRQAIENNEIELAYQPKLDVTGTYLLGAEALARWTSPDLGPVLPPELIAVAEQAGLIGPLNELLMWQACDQAATWQRQGLVVPIALNLSPSDLHQPNLVRRVRNALSVSGLSGDRLCLEITEDMLIEDTAAAARTMRSLGELGVRMAIDDFGTGYSSFAYLAELPVACVKIDRGFIAPLATQEPARKVVASIIGLAHGLGMSVVAEGVETAEQLHFLRDAGCDEIQGFYFSEPLTAQALEDYARTLKPAPAC